MLHILIKDKAGVEISDGDTLKYTIPDAGEWIFTIKVINSRICSVDSSSNTCSELVPEIVQESLVIAKA